MSAHTLGEWKCHEAELLNAIQYIDNFSSNRLSRAEYQKILADSLRHTRRTIAEIEARVLTHN